MNNINVKNRVKIICDPYNKKIEYFHFINDKWKKIEAKESVFCKEEFLNTTIQKKAYEIVDNMYKKYTLQGLGLKICFIGTEEDRNYLERVVRLYSDENNADIVLEENDSTIPSAYKVKESIEEIFSNLENNFSSYSDSEIKAVIGKFNDAIASTIPICVMGLYSSGKSAFINSLIGFELLPSASDPTTAKTYKISFSNCSKISFGFNGEKITLNFTENEYATNRVSKVEILASIEKEIAEVKNGKFVLKFSLQESLLKTLHTINEYALNTNDGAVSDLIEVTVNKKLCSSLLITNKNDFVIFDTPGSNSASNEKHTEVLKKAMVGQTNGLPIFITTPDNMDNSDNKNIMDVINKTGIALDKSNLMIIVNKADGKGKESFENKKSINKIVLKSLDPSGVYFMSSIIGLGNKKNSTKNSTWLNKEYKKIYRTQKKIFGNKDDEDYMQLYKYNIASPLFIKEYAEKAAKADDESLAYYNSGLHCVETAICEFADNYALYNKCIMASTYLEEAIQMLTKSMNGEEKKLQDYKSKLESCMSMKQNKLLVSLDRYLDKQIPTICEDFEKFICERDDKSSKFSIPLSTFPFKKDYTPQKSMKTYLIDTYSFCNKAWNKAKKGTWKADRDKELMSQIKSKVAEIENLYKAQTNGRVSQWIGGKEKQLKEKCIKIIINNNESIPPQQRNLFSTAINTSFEISSYVVKNEGTKLQWRFLWFKHFNEDNFRSVYTSNAQKALSAINESRINSLEDKLEEFKTNIKNSFISVISQNNPDMLRLQQQKQECEKKLHDLRAQTRKVNSASKNIEEIFNTILTEEFEV